MLRSPQPWRLYSRAVSLGSHLAPILAPPGRRLMTLAIETSCDDTSVALLSYHDARSDQTSPSASSPAATLHFHEKVTADNSQHSGIHPLRALYSHRENLGPLIASALLALPPAPSSSSSNTSDPTSATIPIRGPSGTCVAKRKPDFISVTRGPGMRASLSTGIDTAKGLALAWQIPLVGVNHMQAHALTPRLVSALETTMTTHTASPSQPRSASQLPHHSPPTPSFPFLSLLVSGGHTLLVHSKALTEHAILATTTDVAIGDAIDKMARVVCPDSLLRSPREIMYGRLLESFAFPRTGGEGEGQGGGGVVEHAYTAPASRAQQFARRETRWGWSLPVPLAEHKAGKARGMRFSFSGLGSTVEKICAGAQGMGREERVELAREGMRVAFEHLAVRVVWALDSLRSQGEEIRTVVVSGGVASNEYLKTILQSHLSASPVHAHTTLVFPPPALCTDNAAMIAWTGLEMYAAGWRSELACVPLRKWSVDAESADGGILGVGGWVRE